MARTYGAIYVSIWRDPDFLALNCYEQRLYMYLCTQAKLTRAGLLEYSPRRWAGAASDLTVDMVEALTESLHRSRYLVFDETTNEVLVRSYVRNSESWKQPKLMAAVVSAAPEIESPLLRRALLAELGRIPLAELSDEPGTNGAPSVRAKIAKCIGQLRAILGDTGSARPPAADETPAADPENEGNPKPSGTPAEGFGKGIGGQSEVSGTRVSVPVPVSVPVSAAAAATATPPVADPADGPPSAAAQPAAAAAAARTRTPPPAAAPLVDELAAAGLIVGWNLRPDQWATVVDAIDRSGIPALVDHARRSHKPHDPARFAVAWLDGWSSLPPLTQDSPLQPAHHHEPPPAPTARQQRLARNRAVIAQAAAIDGIPVPAAIEALP